MALVDKARRFAIQAHRDQLRKFGRRRYIYHPSQVVKYLRGKSYSDEALLAAGWLHDVQEDCGITHHTIESEFGWEIAKYVTEVSHPILTNKLSRSERWKIYLSHYANASMQGRRLKLADRLCNLREYSQYWQYVPYKERQFIRKVYLRETIELVEALTVADEDTELEILTECSRLLFKLLVSEED